MIAAAKFRVATKGGIVRVMMNDAVPVGAVHLSRRSATIVVNPKTDMGELLKAHGWRFV